MTTFQRKPARAQLNFRVDSEQRELLQRVADDLGLSLSDLFRRGLDYYTAHDQQAARALARAKRAAK